MEDPLRRPLAAELVEPLPNPAPSRRVAALLVAAAPVLIRLGWWWWNHPRKLAPAGEPIRSEFGSWEHTELRLTKRLLGRWKLQVVSTRWREDGAAGGVAGHRRGLPPVLVRAAVINLARLVGSIRAHPGAELPKLITGGRRQD